MGDARDKDEEERKKNLVKGKVQGDRVRKKTEP